MKIEILLTISIAKISGNFQTKHTKNSKSIVNKVSDDDYYFCSSSKIIRENINIKNILKETKIIKVFVWDYFSIANGILFFSQDLKSVNTPSCNSYFSLIELYTISRKPLFSLFDPPERARTRRTRFHIRQIQA